MSIAPVSLAGPAPIPSQAEALTSPARPGQTPFAGLVERFLGGATESGVQADSAVRDLAMGRTDNLHEVMLKVVQADLSFRLILEIRNRLSDAYQEIMKMQV